MFTRVTTFQQKQQTTACRGFPAGRCLYSLYSCKHNIDYYRKYEL